MMISNAPDRTEYKDLKCNQLAVDNEEILCEPIRKAVGVTSPILGISPKQIVSQQIQLTSKNTNITIFLIYICTDLSQCDKPSDKIPADTFDDWV